jgi:hypothetical protein
MSKVITTKIPPDALRFLRLVAAATGEKQYEVLRRLLKAELTRLGINPEAIQRRRA